MFGGHAWSFVSDLDVPAAATLIAAQGHWCACRRVADGVIDEVVDDAAQESRIGLHPAVAGGGHLEPAAALPGHVMPASSRLVQKIRHVDRFFGGLEGAGVSSSEDEQLVGEAAEVLDFLAQRFE